MSRELSCAPYIDSFILGVLKETVCYDILKARFLSVLPSKMLVVYSLYFNFLLKRDASTKILNFNARLLKLASIAQLWFLL